MTISAIIPSYNRRDALARCLTTLLDQDVPCDQYEIVVVVDGSSDGTSEMLQSFGARTQLVVVEQENRGQTAALNAGVNAASGEIILFLDDDLLCDRGLISAHTAAHEPAAQEFAGPTVVIGRMLSVLGSSPTAAELSVHDDLEKNYSQLLNDPVLKWPDSAWAGPNCSMPRATFLAAQGYDEKLFPRRWEDVDLGLRLWKMGVHFRFEPRAITSHTWVKSDRQSWADAGEDGASVVRLCRKHPEMRTHSLLGGVLSAPAWKRHLARMAANHPMISRVTLGALVAVLERLSWLPTAQRPGLRVLRVQHSLAMLAGAQREAGSWRKLTGLFAQRLPVLLYHHVGVPTPGAKDSSLTVSTAKFKRHIWWLRWRGYTPITPAQWLAWCCAGEPLPDKPVLITFDDAFAEMARNALPVLERYGLRGVVFVITRLMESPNCWEGLPVMSIHQIQHWAERGIEIGAHTRTHPDLTAVSTHQAADEVSGSKEDLVKAGLAPVSFAYPYGCFDDHARKLVDGVFALAFTCEEGLNDLKTDPLLMRRTMVQPADTIADLELRLALGWSPLMVLRSRLRIRTRVLKLLRQVPLFT
jgi:GT2 family glycosyltransferase/peptidoglycan/xylan/chitin deacetylase (PgdA/CDA1 family)